MEAPARLKLQPHPASPPGIECTIAASIVRAPDGRLVLDYQIRASHSALILPPEITDRSLPTDGLWRHTCCEVFLGRREHPEYLEYNFSPSGAWAHYAFDAPRVRARSIARARAPSIRTVRHAGGFDLRACIQEIPPQFAQADLDVNITAVLEIRADENHRLSYWALSHDSAVPDFHLRSSFQYFLPINRQPNENRS